MSYPDPTPAPPDSHLEFAVQTGSQYDAGYRGMALEILRLRKALRRIAAHPHQRYDHPGNGEAPYGTGCADGHRCAASIAKEALTEETTR